MDHRATTLTDEISNSWQGLVDTMAEIFQVPAGLIMRLSGEDIEVFVSSRTEGNPYEPGDHETFFDSGLYCETVVRSQQTLSVPDALADPDWRDNPDVKLDMIAYLGMPINLPDGTPFGTICVLDNKENSFSDLYVRLLEQFRGMAENQLRLAVLNEDLDRRNHELQAALDEVNTLKEILPVCMLCGQVRDDEGYWSRLESYLAKHKHIAVSHGLCPDCQPGWEAEMERQMGEDEKG